MSLIGFLDGSGNRLWGGRNRLGGLGVDGEGFGIDRESSGIELEGSGNDPEGFRIELGVRGIDPEGSGNELENSGMARCGGDKGSAEETAPKNRKKAAVSRSLLQSCGGAEGDRTPDLHDANVALSQLSYRPRCG